MTAAATAAAGWRRLGLMLEPGFADWSRTHVQNPFPEALGGSRYRVHFATRDERNRARGGCFEFDLRRPREILSVSRRPTLDLGELGAFDDCGVMPSCVLDVGGEKWMYYTGWSRAVEVPFSFHIGLAISKDSGESYQRLSRAPVLGRNHHDPFIAGSPFVVAGEHGFVMWYVSCTEWVRRGDSVVHYYTVKRAESSDGVAWKTSADLCLDYQEGEHAIARPFVSRRDGRYEMCFSHRAEGATYRLGWAESADGRSWHRVMSRPELEVAASGWDSEMICYGAPFEHGGSRYLLYNGNGYGATGAGLAVIEA